MEEAEKLQKSLMSLHGFLKDKPMEMSVGSIVLSVMKSQVSCALHR